MGIQFYNIKRVVNKKSISNAKSVNTITRVKKRIHSKVIKKLTKNNLNFLRSIKAL